MTRRRFIADEVSGDRAAITGDHADHLIKVLRARAGQEFDIAAANTVRRGRISSVSPDRVEFDLGEELPATRIAEITLVLAIFKFDRMEWAIEKCTELGVARIVPVIARRTDAHLASAAPKRAERWLRLARQASEQSRRSVPPEIAPPVKLAAIWEMASPLRIVLSEMEAQTFLRDVAKGSCGESGLTLAIGPEGGWAEDELHSFHQAGWISASLGETILRAETAAIASVAVVQSLLHEL